MNEALLLASIGLAFVVIPKMGLSFPTNLVAGVVATLLIHALLVSVYSAAMAIFQSAVPFLIPVLIGLAIAAGVAYLRNRQNKG